MPIKEMQEGDLPYKGHDRIKRAWISVESEAARSQGVDGFVALGLGLHGGGVTDHIVIKTCQSKGEYTGNRGASGHEVGWFVAMQKEEALGLAKKIIELAREMD